MWKSVIWAVDPFAKEPELQRSALAALRLLSRDERSIEPVYLMNCVPGGVPYSRQDEVLDRLEKAAVERFNRLVEQLQSKGEEKGLRKLTILSCAYLSLRDGVDALIAYAKENRSDLIIASTRAKKGLTRWLSGSFAETLMLHSNVPVLFVNPLWEAQGPVDEIVFPTDFSPESRAAFDLVMDLAKSMGRGITLFHKIPFQEESAWSKANQWADDARGKGIEVRAEISTELGEVAADAILDYAQSRNCLIAVAARSGPVSVAWTGGTTRRVVRGARVPVWVVHPLPAARSAKEPIQFSIGTEVRQDVKIKKFMV